MHPLEKIVFNNDSDNIEVVNMNNIASSDIKNFVSYAYLRKRSHGFLIEYEEKFIRIDRYQKANLTLRNMNASVFKILPSQIGYTIESDGLCLTKDDENNGLSLKRCYLEQADKSCQLFDFIALDRAFYKNLIDLDSESPLDSADYSEINESDFNLEKKFRQTIFDKQFIDSMKYFYDAAACVLTKDIKSKKENPSKNADCTMSNN
ncbi:hypothetical protein GVAV_003487 [Gurleya vavrai]